MTAKLITRVSWNKRTEIYTIHFYDNSELVLTSKRQAQEYMVENFQNIDKVAFSESRISSSGRVSTGGSLYWWKPVLDKVFGERDWKKGIENRGYNTVNSGGICSYTGSNVIEEIGIIVFGTPSYGDAYYGYDGEIRWKFAL